MFPVEAGRTALVVGDLSGKAVVDLACGEGHYTRMLPGLGATRVVGIDRSEGMIALARDQEAGGRQGIDYMVQDCLSLDLPREFDVAVAARPDRIALADHQVGQLRRDPPRVLELRRRPPRVGHARRNLLESGRLAAEVSRLGAISEGDRDDPPAVERRGPRGALNSTFHSVLIAQQ